MASQTTTSPEVEGIIRRATTFKNPFDILDVTPETTIADIQKKYKRMALLLHPDKCKHPKATEAFDIMKKAASDLENNEQREFWKKMMDRAENEVSLLF
jgi:DnaJ family protein C protein 8